MSNRQQRYAIGYFMIIVSVLGTMTALAQNCDVNFPGVVLHSFSSTCGGSSVDNLTLGKDINMGYADLYVFDAPTVINIFGDLHVDAQGSAKIIIPAGVTVNVYGNMKLDSENSGCRSSNRCTFEIEVQGTLNLLDDLDNGLVTLIWSGAGAVNVVDNFKNSSSGCMACDSGGCPDFDVKPWKCADDGVGCTDSDFCATILNGCSNDTTDPIITSCPGNQIVNIIGPGCSQTVNWDPPQATDNCSLSSLTPNHLPGSSFPKGITIVTYTATDAAGNTSICSFNVNVVDNTAPTISGCANITVNANASCQAVVDWTPPTYTDNCPGTVVSSTKLPGSTFNKGTTVVSYTATDLSGNIATCSFNVNVVDNTTPAIEGCPTNITAIANSSCQAVVSWHEPTVSNNCSGATLVVDKPSGSVFEAGTTQVTYTATTDTGESAICSFYVVVVDNIPPHATAIGNLKAIVGPDCQAIVNWSVPNVVDCNDFQIESTHQPGDEFAFGSTNVTYTLTDALGNKSDYTFHVVVENPDPPLISDCPADITIEADEHGFAIASWTEPTATVVCGHLSFESSHRPGEPFPIGTNHVVYTATDELKNESICSFKIIVSPPKIVVEITNVVTPDGNGINDYLKIENIEKYKENGIVIVDRWGSTIYKATGYDNNKVVWTGNSHSGSLAPTGTYFFTMSIRYGKETIQRTGFIELLR